MIIDLNKYFSKENKLKPNMLMIGVTIKNKQSLHYQIIKSHNPYTFDIQFLFDNLIIEKVYGYEIINGIIHNNIKNLSESQLKDFIVISNIIHQNKYDYSNIKQFTNLTNTYEIICPEHGMFEMSGIYHINYGKGCPVCSRKEQFQNQLHNNDYIVTRLKEFYKDYNFDYSLVDYKKSGQRVNLKCNDCNSIFCVPTNIKLTNPCKNCYHTNHRINNFKPKLLEILQDKGYTLIDSIDDIIETDKVKFSCSKHGIFEQYISAIYKGIGCTECGKENYSLKRKKTTQQFITEAEEIHQDKYGKPLYDYSLTKYTGAKDTLEIICPEHGIFEQFACNHLQGKGCPRCSKRISKSEYELIEWLQSKTNSEILISTKDILGNGKEIDIYIPEHNLAIEYNGLYYHTEEFRSNKYHLEKTEICNSKNIKLIQIFEDEWLIKKDIVKSRILNNLNQSERIYARKCIVKEIIEYDIVKEFLNNNHIQGTIPGEYYIGLYHNKELVSIMTFGKLRANLGFKNINNTEYELLRFCNKLNTTVIGGANKLLKYFVKKHKPNFIVSYADRRWSDGNLYFKLGFTHSHNSYPNYFYVNKNKRENRYKYRKDILVSKYNCPIEMTEKEFCKDVLGMKRIYDCGNMVFHLKIKNL